MGRQLDLWLVALNRTVRDFLNVEELLRLHITGQTTIIKSHNEVVLYMFVPGLNVSESIYKNALIAHLEVDSMGYLTDIFTCLLLRLSSPLFVKEDGGIESERGRE